MTDHRLESVLHHLRRTAAEMAGISDAELLQRFVHSRDEVSFELLMWRHARLVWSVCRRILQNDHDAEDAFQVTFIALARQATRIKYGGSLVGWLYKVAYRAALAARGHRLKRREQQLDLALPVAITTRENRLTEYDSCALDQEISRLPERFQIPVVLCYLEGKTVSETALLLGWPRGTVASRLARARSRLKSRLARRGLEFSDDMPATPNRSTSPILAVAIPVLSKQVLAGAAAESVLAPHVASLTKEVVKAMFLSKLKAQAILVVTVLGFIMAGSGFVIHLYAGNPKPANHSESGEPQSKKPDDLPKPKAPQAAPKTVTAVRPIRREAAPYGDFTGRLVALQQVDIQPTVSGRLESVRFQPGAEVKKGELLFVIDPKSYELAVLKAEAELSRLKVDAIEKNKAVDVAEKLAKKGFETQGEVEKILAQSAAAEAALRPAQVEVEQAKLKLEATKITAPLDGRISESRVDPGNQVYSGSDKATVLASITVLNPIGLNFDMDEKSYLRFRRLIAEKKVKGPGSALTMSVSDEDGFPHEGGLSGFGDRVNSETGTIRVRAQFANPDGLLLPGMFARIRMRVGPPIQVFDLPQVAVRKNNAGQAYVLVVNNRNRVEVRIVNWDQSVEPPKEKSFGKKQGRILSITEGLAPEDRVIVSDAQGLEAVEEVEVERVKDDEGSAAQKK